MSFNTQYNDPSIAHNNRVMQRISQTTLFADELALRNRVELDGTITSNHLYIDEQLQTHVQFGTQDIMKYCRATVKIFRIGIFRAI